MTQQLDLAFNTSNKMDKMLSNSSMQSYTKENNSEIGSKFGSFLDNANKSYSNNTKTNDEKPQYGRLSKQEDKQDLKSKSNNKEVLNKKQNEETNNKQSFNNDYESVDRRDVSSIRESDEMQTTDIIQNVDNSQIEETSEMLAEDLNSLVALNSISSLANLNIIDTQEMGEIGELPELDLSEELPVDAIKSGIKFEAVLTDVEDADDMSVQAVDKLTEDVMVSKEDYISSMYNLKDIEDVKSAEFETVENVQNYKENSSVETLVSKNTEIEMTNLPKSEEVSSVKIVEDEQIDVKKSDMADNISVSDKSEISVKTDEFTDNEKVSMNLENQNNNINNNASKEDEDTSKLVEIDKDDKQDEKLLDKDVASDKAETQSQNVENDVKQEMVEQTPKKSRLEQAIMANKMMREPANAEDDTKSENKVKELDNEILSAKLENAVLENNQVKVENAVDNGKTNVDAEETTDIKEDVKGIEFVKNKFEAKPNDKQETAQAETQQKEEVPAEKIKQRVENVKIQVEEDVKRDSNVQPRELSEMDKIKNANETLEKAGLSTENLKKMDAKVKEIDNSEKDYQSDYRQSSKEMLMRDILQNNALNSNSEAVELKVDFNQELNNKLSQANQLQMQRPQMEELPEINILDQIRAKMALNSQSGMQKITIGLTPESLGKLHIEISRGQNGISAQILADNPQAKEILDKNLDGLKSVLQSQGVNVNNLNVKVAETSRSSDGNNMFNQEDSQFNSNNNGSNSKNSGDAEKEKRAEYEILQKELLEKESLDSTEEVVNQAIKAEETVSIKGGLGNISYKL